MLFRSVAFLTCCAARISRLCIRGSANLIAALVTVRKYFQTEISRLFRKKELYFSVMGIVLILFLSANDGMGNIGGSVLSSVLLSSYDAGFLVAFSLASIPYAAAFTDDLEYNYAKYLVVRGSLGKYVFSKMLVIFISSMLTMGIGITCFSMLCSLGLPWEIGRAHV